MEEFIFFAVIIFFSIIESIARSRKQKRAGELPEGDRPEMPVPAEWDRELPDFEFPTYDADPSYDDELAAGASSSGGATRPRPDRPSSEEMLPGELLEELARLAGRAPEPTARTLEVPKESPPLPHPAPTRPARTPRAPPVARPLPQRAVPNRASSRGEHRIHKSHAGYGTDPSTRAKSLQDDLDPLAQYLSEDAKAVRGQLRSKKTSALSATRPLSFSGAGAPGPAAGYISPRAILRSTVCRMPPFV
jgi:hypothetical protein